MPIIPFISDDKENLNEIFRITKEYNLGSINAWPLHLRGNTKNVFYDFLQEHYAHLLPRFKSLYSKANVSKKYAYSLQLVIEKLRKKYQLYSNYKPTKAVKKDGTQMSLFD